MLQQTCDSLPICAIRWQFKKGDVAPLFFPENNFFGDIWLQLHSLLHWPMTSVIPETSIWCLFLVSCVQTRKKYGNHRRNAYTIQLSLNLATYLSGRSWIAHTHDDELVDLCARASYFLDAERVSGG